MQNANFYLIHNIIACTVDAFLQAATAHRGKLSALIPYIVVALKSNVPGPFVFCRFGICMELAH